MSQLCKGNGEIESKFFYSRVTLGMFQSYNCVNEMEKNEFGKKKLNN